MKQLDRVLVTGGCGFIGSHVVERLLDSGYRVVVLDDLSTGFEANIPANNPSLTLIRGCVTDEKTVVAATKGVEAVIHLAAVVSVQASIEKPAETHRVNMGGTLTALNAATICGVKRFLFASSAAIYGNVGSKAADEVACPEPQTPYGFDKLASEQYVRFYGQRYEMNTTSLRLFNVYGPRQDPGSDYAGVISRFVESVFTSRRVTIHGDGQQSRDFVYVGDVARVFVDLLPQSDVQNQSINVGTGSARTLLDVISALEQLSGANFEATHSAERPGDIRYSQADITRLQKALGYSPATDLFTGLSSLIESRKGRKAVST